MKLFFGFKINQKLLLCTVWLVTVFLASCAPSRKANVRPVSKTRTTTRASAPAPGGTKPTAVARASKSESAETKEESSRGLSSSVSKVISTARSFIGTPYKYGGTTRAGMDCSGLLMNSFNAISLALPRSSADQSKVGREVRMKDLQPGDLVFFATGKDKNKITHVGLVTQRVGENDVKFIHASSMLGVVETNISGQYYQERYRGARRVLD